MTCGGDMLEIVKLLFMSVILFQKWKSPLKNQHTENHGFINLTSHKNKILLKENTISVWHFLVECLSLRHENKSMRF
jgi:hypothetical protein